MSGIYNICSLCRLGEYTVTCHVRAEVAQLVEQPPCKR
ncbi:MAG: hypothetical protein UU98_C0010G0028 [Parcubacteria group bacterium GW2011_GWD2_42_14]|nr:MAG: hypothetical protein UU98_C0010G0028 [Parcubacteria group bacterium GW2011_GWD2_42_14]